MLFFFFIASLCDITFNFLFIFLVLLIVFICCFLGFVFKLKALLVTIFLDRFVFFFIVILFILFLIKMFGFRILGGVRVFLNDFCFFNGEVFVFNGVIIDDFLGMVVFFEVFGFLFCDFVWFFFIFVINVC